MKGDTTLKRQIAIQKFSRKIKQDYEVFMQSGFDKNQALELTIRMYESKSFQNLLTKEMENVGNAELVEARRLNINVI